MKIIVLILCFLCLFKSTISNEYNIDIIDGPSSEKWNFDEIDKLLLEEYKEVKKFGKIQIVYHLEQKNHSEVGIDFKLNNGLVVLNMGNYLTLDENDQKMLLSIFQSTELKSKNESNNNYFDHIGKNWFSAHFIGDSNGMFRSIDKTITWISNNTQKSLMYNSLQQLFLKYIKRFNENNK